MTASEAPGQGQMIGHLWPLAALLAGVAFLLLGSGLLSTVLAIRGGIEGFDSQMLGILGSMYFVGFLAGTYAGPALIRRVGHIRAFAFFTAANACVALLHELLPHPWVWAALRLVTGLAMVGLYTAVESWLNSYAQPAHRTQIFSVYMGVNLGALAIAQQFLHFASPAGATLFIVAALSICAAVMPVAATRLSQPVVDEVQTLGLRALYDKAPVAFVAALLTGFSQGAFWGLGAVWADRSGLDHSMVAAFISAVIVGGALCQWPIGRLTARIDRGYVITVVSLGAAVLALALLFAGRVGGTALLVAGFAYGGFAFALYPMAVARMMDRLVPAEVLSGCGSLLLLHGIGAAIGPFVAGSLMDRFGPDALPAWFILVEVILGLATWGLARRVPADVEHQTAFVPMVRTAPAAFEILDPEHRDAEAAS